MVGVATETDYREGLLVAGLDDSIDVRSHRGIHQYPECSPVPFGHMCTPCLLMVVLQEAVLLGDGLNMNGVTCGFMA
jgi:hypothetical protein